MPILTIREKCLLDDNAGFAATLRIDHQAEYEITVHDPFDARKERELEFYFEQWIKFPFDNQVIAKRAAESVTIYGEELFKQVFADLDAYSDYKQACREGLTQLRIEVEGRSTDFQALHWEALKDPKQPRPLAVEGVFTRKFIRKSEDRQIQIALQSSPTINLLVVTARPDEESDVGYRTISRPLIEAIHKAQLRVNVEILRPGTYQALSDHLEKKEGRYHIVHFDAHGGLMTYGQYQQGVKADRYTYQVRYGRDDLERYDGVKAFLFLEGESKGKADPVEAEELAKLLTGKGIPICILNACQSGKQVKSNGAANGEGDANDGVGANGHSPAGDGDETDSAEGSPPAPLNKGGAVGGGIDIRETSLGSRLMAAGVQMVVAMGYSVTVTAAALMMEKLYGQLFAQQGIPEAIRLGRKELYNQKNRRVYFNQTVELEDWLLPVVYANRDVDLKLREFAPQEKAEYLMQRRQRYRFGGATYGFVGRDLEILKIEKALLRHNVLLLRGMGGTGKTTLLNYLREWWQTTNFVRDVFYFGYDETAHTLQQILRVMGKGLYPDTYEFAAFEAMPLEAQMEDVADHLRAKPYGLMLDNLESVTGQALAIQNTLPEAEQAQIREFLLLLRGGETKVVLGSRSGEEWLADAFTYDGKANVYPLAGLDPESRTVLAEKILDAQVGNAKRIAELRKDDGFKRLMKLLAGYPLAMEVVLANLVNQSPQQILAGLQAADVDLNVGGGDKTNNILKCVEYSHSNLSPDAQKLLVCLAPFNSFIDRATLPYYAQQLQQREPFKDYDFGQFDAAIQEAIQWGLLSGMNPDGSPLAPLKKGGERLLSIQPIFPYFLRTKLNELDAATRDALDDGFKAHYQGLAGSYQRLMSSKNPQERQLGIRFCRLEYEHLHSALQICLQKQENIQIYRCLDKYLDLVSDISQKLRLSQSICDASKNYLPELLANDIGYFISEAFLKTGVAYYQAKAYELAKDSHQEAVRLLEINSVISKRNKKLAIATNYHQLGMVAQELREYEQARSHYQKALDIKIEFNDRHSQAGTYHQLGVVAEELREYEQARSYYQKALNIYIEFNDRYPQATVYHQLGMVAQKLREYEQARSYYQKTLDIYIKFNDRYEQADVYHQLGMVAQALREYEQARSYYQKALDIYIKFKNRYPQATVYHQLGMVAQELREFEQARSHFQQALDICIEFNDRYSQARTYHQLGMVAQELREFEQARSHFQQALDLKIEFNDRYIQASTYHQLGIVAQALREYEQARSHYQQALDLKIEFNDRYSQASTYFQLAKVFEATGNLSEATSCYLQDLQITAEFNDEHGLGISMRNLARFYREHPDEKFLAQIAQCLNTTAADVQQLFANFNRDE